MNPTTAAQELLEDAWAGRGFPVDPVQIAKELGIDVFEADLPATVSGALIKEKDQDPAIFLNAKDSRNRKRFTCAHEIGHFIWRQGNDGEQYEYLDLRGDHSSTGTNPEEVFANQFAANLLMPAKEVGRLCAEDTHRFRMAYHFGVSDDAMRFRLSNLSL